MKLVCEIIAVKGNGETLTVTMQGSSPRDAEWRSMGRHEIQIPETAVTQRAFHLGRKIELVVRLKP